MTSHSDVRVARLSVFGKFLHGKIPIPEFRSGVFRTIPNFEQNHRTDYVLFSTKFDFIFFIFHLTSHEKAGFLEIFFIESLTVFLLSLKNFRENEVWKILRNFGILKKKRSKFFYNDIE